MKIPRNPNLKSIKMNTNQTVLNAFAVADLSPEDAEAFLELWKPISFPKGAIMTEVGQYEKRFYVVLSGVQAVYLINPKGDRVTIGFSFDGSYSGIYDSFAFGSPSAYFLQALTPSELVYITPEEYHALFDRFPGFDRWGRIVHGQLLMGRVQRELELTTLSSEERFVRFMRRCPEPLRQIPQKWLASYLNMSPETFSRLQNSVAW